LPVPDSNEQVPLAGAIGSMQVLPVVPMFHAMAWGIPYCVLMTGCKMCLISRFLTPDAIVRFIVDHGVTMSGAVPTIWQVGVTHGHATTHPHLHRPTPFRQHTPYTPPFVSLRVTMECLWFGSAGSAQPAHEDAGARPPQARDEADLRWLGASEGPHAMVCVACVRERGRECAHV
jgi:hypothetical protein